MPAPFRLLNDRQLRRQARRDVRATSLPLVRQINREAQAGEQNVAGIAQALAASQSGYQGRMADIYGRARGALEGYQQQGQQQLGAAGADIGGDLAKQLALSGSQPGNFGSDLARVTAGFQERGRAELGALAMRQAAAEEFGAKLPELARLSGLQGVQERAAQARQSVSRVQSEIPSQVAGLIREGRNRNFQIGAANLAYAGDVYGEQQQTARTAMQQEGATSRNQASISSRERIATKNRRAARARAIIAEGGRNARARASAARQGHSLDEQQSAQRGVLVDKQGRVIKDYRGKPIPYRKGRRAGGAGGGSASGL